MRLIAFALIFLSSILKAQTDTVYSMKYIDRSTRFAQLTLGGDLLILTSGQTDFPKNGLIRNVGYGNTVIPRLSIGGLHFWEHADFYVSFPLSFLAIANQPADVEDAVNLEGIETGARVYPWKIKPNSLRPFVGISFRLKEFSLGPKSRDFIHGYPVFQKMTNPLQVGVTYASKKHLISVSAYYNSLQRADTYVAPNQVGNTTFKTWSLNVSLVRYWDSDRNMRNKSSVRQLNVMDSLLRKEKRMSAWYWGIGPSAGLQMSQSEFLKETYPYLYNDNANGIMPDITFGRFFEKPDMNIGLSYRTLGSTLKGFDTEVRLRRHSFMIEAYKNLFNYLGFVPFVGVTGSIENLTTTVNGFAYAETKPAIGVIFGWDIRVTKTGTSLLRTNLRWIPDLHMTIDSKKMMFNQLEFNFIQWVQFIGRKKAYLKYSR
jgi:hypothetical protein